MTLVACFDWPDGGRYMIGDTKVTFDTGTAAYEDSKLLEDSGFVFGFSGDAPLCDYIHNKILDHPRKTLGMLDDIARDAHEYTLEKYPEGSTPEADILVAVEGDVILLCSTGSTHILRPGFHAVGCGEKFAHGFWHSRSLYSDVETFAQDMVRCCSWVDPNVGGPVVVIEV